MKEIDIAKELGIKESPKKIKGWTNVGCTPLTKRKILVVQKHHKIPSTDLTLNFLLGIYMKTERE